jgi:hypothetical protein
MGLGEITSISEPPVKTGGYFTSLAMPTVGNPVGTWYHENSFNQKAKKTRILSGLLFNIGTSNPTWI